MTAFLSWTESIAPATQIERYEVWRSEAVQPSAADFTTSFSKVYEIEVERDSFGAITNQEFLTSYQDDDTDFADDNFYYYYIRAVPVQGPSARSEYVLASAAVTPGELTATADNTNQLIELEWTPATSSNGSIVRYDVYRSFAGGEFERIAQLDDLVLAYTDEDLAFGGYLYYVRAIDNLGASARTNEVAASIVEDPFFDDTFLLIHVENDAIYEVTGVPTISVVGGGAVSTVQAKFGTQSFFNPGTNAESTNYVSVVGALDDYVFPGELTWEMWVFVQAYLGGYTNFISNNINFPGAGFIQLAVGPGVQTFFFNSSTGSVAATPNGIVTVGAWHHLAMTRDAANMARLFVDGILRGSNTINGTIGGNNLGVSTFDLMRGIATDNDDVNGYFEEFRVTKRCRYTANFTVPNAPFEPFP